MISELEEVDSIGGFRTTVKTDRHGRSKTYLWDSLGRIVKTIDHKGETSWHQYFDETDAHLAIGTRTIHLYDEFDELAMYTIDDDFCVIFDSRGNRISERDGEDLTTWTYDSNDNIVTETGPDGIVKFLQEV